MPALNFTVFVNKVESGEKRQTIRPPRKYPIKVKDRLYLYTGMRHKNRRKLGESVCKKITPVVFGLIDLFEDGSEITFWVFHKRTGTPWPIEWVKQLAIDDGFSNIKEFGNFFVETYKFKPGDFKDFDIIKW